MLELDDGSYLTESLPIIEYLEETSPEPPMIGRSAIERARVRELERLADIGVLIPVARVVHATKSPLGWPPSPEVAALFPEHEVEKFTEHFWGLIQFWRKTEADRMNKLAAAKAEATGKTEATAQAPAKADA